MGNFEEVPNKRKYLHLLGFYKQQNLACNKMDVYVQKFYPKFYNHLENLLNLKPKLSSFGFRYKSSDLVNLTNSYLSKIILEDNISQLSKTQKIYSKNVLSEGALTTFLNYIKNKEDFYLIKLTNYSFEAESENLTIEQLHEECYKIKLLAIDYVIFDIINSNIKYSDFEDRAVKYIDDDFPKEEIDNFLEVLSKRISIFISFGIFYPLHINKYKKILRNNSFPTFLKNGQEEVDACI
ncbi:hypothetical protein P8625_14320 [Tenacibaculum tangerinum]|uniref:DUF6734 domain-containing protein n=1 Tax=Tenacibaculum tangerinum TaxID=3038772 RepID=A0ABY8L192_9FLAO|nr:hypothetical protein P8625_14320 [Tenacibaculum tangerinum]